MFLPTHLPTVHKGLCRIAGLRYRIRGRLGQAGKDVHLSVIRSVVLVTNQREDINGGMDGILMIFTDKLLI